ncbi:hypothetical protein CISG_07384 [Coccidioides immitis RMSCC 3703]|uniref:Uncharacterized protein n=2 Tax=Coccidioides immitis TaxID=5501 RepID=A0A0J8TY23_COCIT|nr:hypothetical protein CIRG_03836 [Coccidioides immitis RMSCC 2394]KMU78867.1 hypothetical protein CISG_07384 [Coccidioides immitis RMSCC 3703]
MDDLYYGPKCLQKVYASEADLGSSHVQKLKARRHLTNVNFAGTGPTNSADAPNTVAGTPHGAPSSAISGIEEISQLIMLGVRGFEGWVSALFTSQDKAGSDVELKARPDTHQMELRQEEPMTKLRSFSP